MRFISPILASLASATLVACQSGLPPVPNTFPHNYTGIPKGGYSPTWQKYFEVTETLPNVTNTRSDPLSRSFAGNIGVNRAGHSNDTLFFWGFEKEPGSLTANAGEREDEPWLVWLNGGPGSSSFLGFFTENGPLHVTNDYSIVKNNYSWDKLADAFWVDQPVGTGYSTADSTGYIPNEDQMGLDFLGFLSNLVKVFPSLAKRPFYLTGESYAGTYIPYIAKTYFSVPAASRPVNLKKFAVGDGAIASLATFEELPVLQVIETYPQLINFDTDVYDYFKRQTHLCGYDLNLSYPEKNGHFPTLRDPFSTVAEANIAEFTLRRASRARAPRSSSSLLEDIASRYVARHGSRSLGRRELQERDERRRSWIAERSVPPGAAGRVNETGLDPFYGCFLYDEMSDFATNFSFPWSNGEFDPYDVPDALNPEAPMDASVFLNNNETRGALHAPTSKDWESSFNYPFGSTYAQVNGTNEFGDPSIEPMAFLTDLAANASAHNVSIIWYSGNDDALVGHRGTQVTIQNTTFGGIQGFTRKPSTPWYDDSGNFAGIVHQERGISYVLFIGAGHLVPQWKPEAAFYFVREFILGSNPQGSVTVQAGSRGHPAETVVVGGEDPKLAEDIYPGTSVIFYGSGTTASSTIAPSASLAFWGSFLATATPVAPRELV